MKIAYLSTFYPYRGGIAQFNALLYRVLEKQHKIKSFTFTTQYPDLLFPGKSQLVSDNDIADKISALQILNSVNPISYIKTANEIIKYNPDLLIMKFWMPFFAPSLGYVAGQLKKKGCKVISIIDNAIPHEKRIGDNLLTNYFINRNNGFIVMSNTVEKDLLSLKPKAQYTKLLHPLYNHFGKKIDKSIARKKLNIQNNKKVLLFFGFIRSYKGLDLLIQALAELPEDYVLIIAGEVYGNFNKYQELIDSKQLNNRIALFNRYIGDDEVPYFFSAADLCVLPYKSATQSGITGIALHFELPIIATDTGSLKEMIEPFNTGLMVDKPDSGQIKDAIIKYFDKNLNDYCINNIKKFKKLCSWQNFADNLVDFYHKLS